jgi:hypothetical protein
VRLDDDAYYRFADMPVGCQGYTSKKVCLYPLYGIYKPNAIRDTDKRFANYRALHWLEYGAVLPSYLHTYTTGRLLPKARSTLTQDICTSLTEIALVFWIIILARWLLHIC